MRDRLKEGCFGYDHSHLLALHLESNELSLEMNDSSYAKLLVEKVQQGKEAHKLSYSDWKRKKETEDRIRRTLKMKVLRSYYEQTLMKEQNDEEKMIEGKRKVRQWLRLKKKSAKNTGKTSGKEKALQEALEKEKALKADENYRTWLREKLIQANKIQVQRRKQQRKALQQKKELQIEAKLRNEHALQQWESKKRHNSKSDTTRISQKLRKTPRNPLKQISGHGDLNQRLQIKEVKYGSSRPPLHRAALHIEEFNSFANTKCENLNPESNSISFLSESYESI